MENVENLITEEIKFNVLTEVCSFINSSLPSEQQLKAIVDAANKVLGVRNSSLVLFDQKTQLLHFHVTTGEKSQELEKMTIKPGEGIVGWVIKSGEPLVAPDVTKEPRYNPQISNALNFETRSILCVPIRSRNKIVGAFEAVNRLDERPFDTKDLPLLTAFASLIGIVLENSNTWQSVEQTNLELEHLILAKTREIEAVHKNLITKTQRLALTTKIISLINSNHNMTEIFVGVGEQLCKLVPLSYITIVLLKESDKLTLLEIFPSPQNLVAEGIKIPFDDPVVKYVVQYKRSIFHNRPRWYRCFLDEGRFLEQRLETMLCTPIMSSETVLGTLNLGSVEKHQYPKEAVDIVIFIAKQLGVALERENLQRALEAVNQELNAKTIELRKSIISIGDANLKLFNMQEQLREKDKAMKNLLQAVQKKNEELNTTLAELKQTQTQLVQSEKMASLGQLVAGIAHELNTPAGAIKAASEIIPDYIQKIFSSYEKLINSGLSPEHRKIVVSLVNVMVDSAKEQERKTTAAIREQSRILTQRLQEHNVPNSRLIAKDIARCYLEDWFDPILELINHYQPKLVMDFLNNCSRILISSRDNQLSINTISKIIRALKSYSYLDQSQERTVDLNEDIENTLTILHSQIPKNITIIRKFGILPKISCLGSELNQVWTNIIQNALQILDNQEGIITVETLANSQSVIVRITDDGPGIPEEIQTKIFDPFFTTKRGKTTGLGLSIAHQVVDRHNGNIQVHSVSGETTFEITLPKEGFKFKHQEIKSTKTISGRENS